MVVLICISLIIRDVEHFFMHFFFSAGLEAGGNSIARDPITATAVTTQNP